MTERKKKNDRDTETRKKHRISNKNIQQKDKKNKQLQINNKQGFLQPIKKMLLFSHRV